MLWAYSRARPKYGPMFNLVEMGYTVSNWERGEERERGHVGGGGGREREQVSNCDLQWQLEDVSRSDCVFSSPNTNTGTRTGTYRWRSIISSFVPEVIIRQTSNGTNSYECGQLCKSSALGNGPRRSPPNTVKSLFTAPALNYFNRCRSTGAKKRRALKRGGGGRA